jgi:glycosyltransferase involved in cell wall biosynthesis
MNKYKIIMVPLLHDVKTGGEQYFKRIYEYFMDQGIDIEPIYIEDHPNYSRSLGLLLDCFISNIWFFNKLVKYSKLNSVALLEDFHSHPRLVLCNALLKVFTKNIKIFTLMQLSLFYHGSLKNPLMKKLDEEAVRHYFRQTDVILCNSEYTRQQALTIRGVRPDKVKIVYCGHDEFEIKNHERKAKDKICILFVGQIKAYKGIDYLLKAVSLLSNNNFIVNIVGNIRADVNYYGHITSLIEKFFIKDKVVFHGHINNREKLSKFYTEADIFVLPSLVEGFAIVLLEAMSFGLPIVATNAGAIPELVKDNENGFLVPPADAKALAIALNRLMDSLELREKLGANGLNFYQANQEFYSWDKVGERIMNVFATSGIR